MTKMAIILNQNFVENLNNSENPSRRPHAKIWHSVEKINGGLRVALLSKNVEKARKSYLKPTKHLWY